MARGNVKLEIAHKKSPRNSAGQAPYPLVRGSRIFAAIKNKLRRKMFLVVNESIGSKTNVRGTIRVTPPYKGDKGGFKKITPFSLQLFTK